LIFKYVSRYHIHVCYLVFECHRSYSFINLNANDLHGFPQGHRFWYQSKAHMRLPMSDYLLYCTVSNSYGWLYVKFSLATGGRFTLTPSLRVIPCGYRTSGIPLQTRFFGLHVTRRMFRCIFNHFYVIGPKSYRFRRNNAKYTAITPFKVIQGHQF